MVDKFIKAAAITPDIKVGDTDFNAKSIIKNMEAARDKEAKLAVFPELCVTGYTCGDLFLQDALLTGALDALAKIINASKNMDMVVLVGLPFMRKSRLYNVAAAIHNGSLLGMVPKQYIPNYSEFYEARHFAPACGTTEHIDIKELGPLGKDVCFGSRLLFEAENMPDFVLGVEICEDLWMPAPPSCRHAQASATVIANLSASDEAIGKSSYRLDLVRGQSARLICAYIYADAGEGESTTDLVFSGHDIIAENGSVIAESKRFCNGSAVSEIDLGRIASERRRMTTFKASSPEKSGYEKKLFKFDKVAKTALTRTYPRTPFVPDNKSDRDARCEEILTIQASGLKKRLDHTNCKNAVIGISGGLDSTLALLATTKAFDMLSLDRRGICAVTMPCFGTTDRTHGNALALVEKLGASLREIPIGDAVNIHFRDIGHDSSIQNATYENSQARIRTLILMDLANELNGIAIGTGDMSELALGWATYNGDHMSMYGINCSIPKTLVKYLVRHCAETTSDNGLRNVLYDILDTPVSPELLPPKDGEISQKTEDIVGPYELHDFFLYYMMRFGYAPSKIFRIAKRAFDGEYGEEAIFKWLNVFYRRFFSQQFKRSCLPDGPKVGSVSLSPRGDWRMPSDASENIWLKDLEKINPGGRRE